MQPSRTRLTCRAHNRFTPSIALWQHFVAPWRPFFHQERQSSTASKPAEDSDHNDATRISSTEARGLGQLEGGQYKRPTALIRSHPLRIRKPKIRGDWHTTKAEGSIASNKRSQAAAREASLDAPGILLAQTQAAVKASSDYEGVVVKPMTSPKAYREANLPWCLQPEELTMKGIERLGVEIERFYEYAKPSHTELVVRRHLIEQVRAHVKDTLPDHELEVFGSERTGIALATSDIDFRLLRKEQMEDPALAKLPPTSAQRNLLMRDLHQLHNRNLVWHKAYINARLRYARYPLISLQDRQSNLDVQIVLANDTSLSREIMEDYMNQYHYLRQLYLVIKTIFDVRGLSDVFHGGFGSYSLFMMLVASIRHNPHPRNDAAGGLINFLKFYRDFPTAKQGISIEPVSLFAKQDVAVLTNKVKQNIEEGRSQPLPSYMLCLRDPADKTNDLGRKAIAIKHVQATFTQLCFNLSRDMAVNTRPSLLDPLLGTSYMLNINRRAKLRNYGYTLSQQLSNALARKAHQIREEEKTKLETKEEAEKRSLANAKRDEEWQRTTEERNEKLRLEAQRIAVLEHGDAMASVLGMPSVEDDASMEQQVDAEMEKEVKSSPIVYSPAEPRATALEQGAPGSALAHGTDHAEDGQR